MNDLVAIYRAAQTKLRSKLYSIDITEFQKWRTEQVLTQINAIIRELNLQARSWAKGSMGKIYDSGVDLAGEQLRKLRVTTEVDKFSRIHTAAIDVLMDNTSLDLLSANDSMAKTIGRYIRTTQQRLIEDQRISDLIAQGIIEGETRRTVSDSLLKEFGKRMEEAEFITINGRNYEPRKYAELVARTRGLEASNQAAINTALQYGVDLVQVSVHSGACERCEAIQGKIYSISGTSKDFPALSTIQVPVHPHCRHVLLPVTAIALRQRGTFEELSRLSMGTSPITSVADLAMELA